MEFFLIIAAIIGLVIFYFLFGAIIKFLWGWMPLCVGGLLGLGIGLFGGNFLYGSLGVIIVIVSLVVTNSWQDTNIYLSIEEKLDKIFYFKD